MEERINEAWDRAIAARRKMQVASAQIRSHEETAKMDNVNDYLAAKNAEYRRVLLLKWLADDEDYHRSRRGYDNARDDFRLAMLEIERLKMLVDSARVAALR